MLLDKNNLNYDPHVFENPYEFNKNRDDLNESIILGGHIGHILNGDISKGEKF